MAISQPLKVSTGLIDRSLCARQVLFFLASPHIIPTDEAYTIITDIDPGFWRLRALAKDSTEYANEAMWVEMWETYKGAFRGWVKANLRKWLTSDLSAPAEEVKEKWKGVEEMMGELSISIPADMAEGTIQGTDQAPTVKPLAAPVGLDLPPQKPPSSPAPNYDQYNSPTSGVGPASPPNPAPAPAPTQKSTSTSTSKPASSNTEESRLALTEANLTAHSGAGGGVRYDNMREGVAADGVVGVVPEETCREKGELRLRV
ncbi:hypothetical protein ACHAQD_008397 [Fusarium lateritium]